MSEESYKHIQALLRSNQPEDLHEGLALIRQEILRVGSDQARPLFEMASAMFFIDPLDRPEFAPVLDEAITLVVGFGAWVIEPLLENLDAGDVKAQMAIGSALGRLGADAIDPLLAAYAATDDPDRKTFILFAFGKTKTPRVVAAAPIVLEAAGSPDREIRDTATRTLGKLVESITPGTLPEVLREAFVSQLVANLADDSPSIRSKAVRSLGKMMIYGFLTPAEREQLRSICQRLLGKDGSFEWDRAYVVRREAEEAMYYLQEQQSHPSDLNR